MRVAPAESKYEGRDVCDILLPRSLKRDELWNMSNTSIELEFVVDNQLVAGLTNLEVTRTHCFYLPIVRRVRQRIVGLLKRTFDYKAGILQPVDWRPREFNSAADLVADHVLANKYDVQKITVQDIGGSLREYEALQFFCDGGFDGSRYGSMAFVLVGFKKIDSCWKRCILGYQGVLVEGARSAFQCELGALDLATEAASRLESWVTRRDAITDAPVKRARLLC